MLQEPARLCVNCLHAPKGSMLLGRLWTVLYATAAQLQEAILIRPKRAGYVQGPSPPPLSCGLADALEQLAAVRNWTVRCVHENFRVGLLSEACYAFKPKQPRVSS
jgi:hypothetical protein